MRFVKIFGAERTGTIWMQQLIKLNFRDGYPLSNMFGWKHGKVQDPAEWLEKNPESDAVVRGIFKVHAAIPFVLMVKNPYTWRISIERWVTNCKNCREWDLEYYLDRFNDHYLSWHEDLIERQHDFFRRGMIVRYEDLLRDTTEVLENVATITGFELSEEIFIPKKVPQSKRFNEIDRAHYLHRPRLPKEEIEIINRHISDEFFKLYNYERIEY